MIDIISELLRVLMCIIAFEFAILFGKFTIEMISGDEE